MGRLIAIGDIHGRLSKLTGLIEQIAPTRDDRLVFLGDYIDRGAESFECVELLIRMQKELPHTIMLRGNHEDFIVSLFMGNLSPYQRDVWLKMNGGEMTMASYRNSGCYLKEHQAFYEKLPLKWETDEYFFCHAGVRPGIPLEGQKPSDLLGIREPFLSSNENFGKVVVHGHSIVKTPDIRQNRVNIDTGAGGYGPLTAIELPSCRIWQQL